MNEILDKGNYRCIIDNREITIEVLDGHIRVKMIDKLKENDNAISDKEKESVVRFDIRDGTFHVASRGRFITGNPNLKA